jgi:phage tail-like protein
MVTARTLSTDPLRNFKFVVSVMLNQGGITAPNNFANLGFMQAQGVGIAIEPLTYREGGDNTTTRKMPGQADFNPVTLTKGLFPNQPNAWYWMSELFSVMNGQGGFSPAQPVASSPAIVGSQAPDFRTYIYINVLEHPNNTAQSNNALSLSVLSFKLVSAWVMAIAFSDLDAGGNAVGVQQMQIAYEGFDMQWGNGGYVANPVGW